jgi:DNA polymerase-3 subunit gamma/tau
VLDDAVAHLGNPKWEETLREALEEYIGRPVKLSVEVGQPPAATPERLNRERSAERQQAARSAIEGDPRLNSLLERFDGRIDPDSIRPVE